MYRPHDPANRAYARHAGLANVQAPSPYQVQGPDRSIAGHKRKFEALRDLPSTVANSAAHSTAPPVPSFGQPILPHSRPSRDADTARGGRQGAKPSLFGLRGETTAYISDPEDLDLDEVDDADLDEEAAYAQLGAKLVFEYDGSVVKLDSEADLARWHEERKRRWPTQSRIDAKQDERTRTGAERRRLLEGAYALRQPGFKFRSAQERHDARLTARPSRTADASLQRQKAGNDIARPAPVGLLGLAGYESDESVEDQPSSAAVEAGVDDNEEDEAPEQTSTKAAPGQDDTSQRACKYFFHYGKCREGDKCAYRHEARADGPAPAVPAAQRRQQIARCRKVQQSDGKRGIHQLLVEQEHEAADRLALQVIKYLGSVGFFKEA